TFACLQNDIDPGQWRRLLEASFEANRRGAHMAPQVAARPTSLLMGLQSSAHPFIGYASYHALAPLPIDERVRRGAEPAVRKAILEEKVQSSTAIAASGASSYHKLFPLGDPPDYEPAPEKSVKGIAEREGRTPQEVAYDLLLQRDGRELLYFPLL